jgi:hypothetical protein
VSVAAVVACVLVLVGGLVDHRGLGGAEFEPSRLSRARGQPLVERRWGDAGVLAGQH